MRLNAVVNVLSCDTVYVTHAISMQRNTSSMLNSEYVIPIIDMSYCLLEQTSFVAV